MHRKVIHYALTCLLLYTMLQIGKRLYQEYSLQGKNLSQNLSSLDNLKNKKHALVFWATWCPPCKIELTRVQEFIDTHPENKNQILAINMGESQNEIDSYLKDNNFSFSVLIDSKSEIASQFKVKATPTIIFISEDQNIYWYTSGLSPFLNLRLQAFFIK